MTTRITFLIDVRFDKLRNYCQNKIGYVWDQEEESERGYKILIFNNTLTPQEKLLLSDPLPDWFKDWFLEVEDT